MNDLEFFTNLLNETEAPSEIPVSNQTGPLRRYDTEMRCTSRRCGSSTFFKVRGMPLCMMHSLLELNKMLVEKGENDI